MRRFLNWLNDRTGYSRFMAPVRRRMLPDGPSWLLTTAPVLLWLVVIEVVTGLLLMTTYSPSSNNAWASVNYIEQSPGGAFIRGLHHYCAQAILIVFILHIIRIIIGAAFRALRELIWVSGLLLLPVIVLWKVSGNPLPGTLDGLAQIEVEGNIVGSTPVVGPLAREVLIGGDKVGNLTLTHLYFLHVGLMPLVGFALLGLHITQIYRHGLSNQDQAPHPERVCSYVPYQSWRNMFALAVVVGGSGFLAWNFGAGLGPPADPDLPNSPRPVWYFLWLFELRNYFSGSFEFIATIIIPGAILGFLLLLPLIDRSLSHTGSRVMRFAVVLVGLLGCVTLTVLSVNRDRTDHRHQTAVSQIKLFGERARRLAQEREIPPEGAAQLLRRDGMLLFYKHCLACHSHADSQGQGLLAEKPSAPNLHGVGTRAWLAGWLDPDRIRGTQYFGATKFKDGEMVKHIAKLFADAEKPPELSRDDSAQKATPAEKTAELRERIRLAVIALSAEAKLSREVRGNNDGDLKKGRSTMAGKLGCTECHKFRDEEGGDAPDLTGYASREWLRGIIANPTHERFYRDTNDRMPAFASNADPKKNVLTADEIDLLVDFLRAEDLSIKLE